jgi:hypothetical protein
MALPLHIQSADFHKPGKSGKYLNYFMPSHMPAGYV